MIELTSQAGVQVRTYTSVASFQVEAAALATAGWEVVERKQTTGALSLAGKLFGIAGCSTLLVGLLIPALVVGSFVVALACFVLAVASRHKRLIVTYRASTRL